MNSIERQLIPNENYFNNQHYIREALQIENPENTLAKEESVRYLELLKQKLKNNHLEKMQEIKNTHTQIMKSMQYNSLNNYVSGLTSPDRLKINSIEVYPFREKRNLFGFKIRESGITLIINK